MIAALLGDYVQNRAAVDDLHELVAAGMAFPGRVTGEFRAEDIAVAVGRQRDEGTLALRSASVVSGRRSRSIGNLPTSPFRSMIFITCPSLRAS
jgi:hypothetical protein